jgi:arsenite oxidase large subunit
MAYKRQIDRLPIIPKDAKEFNVTCHYCIVGCGYKAYTWPTNKQGGTAADQNMFGVKGKLVTRASSIARALQVWV